MKRIYTIFMASMLTFSAFAQHRYHPENVDNHAFSNTSELSRQHRLGTRESAPLPCFGSPHIPVVLVQFADLKFKSDTLNVKDIEHSDENVRAFYNNYCNGSGIPGQNYTYSYGSYGSTSDYFIEQSDSLFKPYFHVIGPVTLSDSYAYYGKDNSESSKDVNISQFYREAIKLSIEQGVDWKEFDNDGDGKYDFVFFIYAGEGQNAYGGINDCTKEGHPEKANLLWPKESAFDFTVDSYKFGGYGITNEIYNGRTDGVGTMCHEVSHGLGLPDMYDTSYKAFGMDYWDLMDAGNYCRTGRCPCAYSTYERDFMGWRKLVEITSLTEPQTITLEPIQKGGVGYKLVNPNNKDEYYILENRQRLGFDNYFGWVASSHNGFKVTEELGFNHGMLVTHVDYALSAWSSNKVNINASHQRMTILPADGKLITSIDGYDEAYFKSMAGDLFPGYMNVTEIPSERFTLFTGGTLPINITNIHENEDLTITLEINGGAPTGIEEIVDNEAITSNASMYYDLSGRPVLEPTKGIYVKNGKKVFVK